MNIVDDLLKSRDRLDDAIKALIALGIQPTVARESKEEKKNQPQLSEREREILDLLGKDADTHAIAKQLGLKKKTVEAHRDNIRKRHGISSSHELVRLVKEGKI